MTHRHWGLHLGAGLQGVEHNSEAALQAVSQGRGRAAYAHMSPAETIAAQRCLRSSNCSKPLGHAGFCDSGKASAMMRHNSLAGLAAAAEQAANASAGVPFSELASCTCHLAPNTSDTACWLPCTISHAVSTSRLLPWW